MQAIKINVTRIDKSALFPGKNGKYLDIVLHENKTGPDQYGNDGFVTQAISKERRDAGERGPIIGNWKHLSQQTPPARQESGQPPEIKNGDDNIPF